MKQILFKLVTTLTLITTTVFLASSCATSTPDNLERGEFTPFTISFDINEDQIASLDLEDATWSDLTDFTTVQEGAHILAIINHRRITGNATRQNADTYEYHIAGWSLDANGEYMIDSNSLMPNNSITVFAQWEAIIADEVSFF